MKQKKMLTKVIMVIMIMLIMLKMIIIVQKHDPESGTMIHDQEPRSMTKNHDLWSRTMTHEQETRSMIRIHDLCQDRFKMMDDDGEARPRR